ncbi:hypothetical protein MNEG_14556 [Monoraphidium neglectum]|uniref:Protein Mpv17 n=1 Tax=Monoraphidium neglectum TaxID=145388 RepID=A0A0D2MDW6_9CHLO|nr:hypothetical protein MNEG_14556 [Monoraphidium neglectum]KIY93405.1 hypothetical protein MNEG_14556 [Monoraphidium neglectum]|eukprot:XP_013892425.1 hypothetical protein MNEG_14556 [Monoraphidium neglectum]
MPALAANYYVWPAAQLLNFTLVPQDLRILYVNVISIAWTAYISNMASSTASDAPEASGGAAAAATSEAAGRAEAERQQRASGVAGAAVMSSIGEY